MKIFNNFLPEENFLHLQNNMMGSNFPWYYNDAVVDSKNSKGFFQFVHTFFLNNKQNSSYLTLLDPLINKIKPLTLLRIKANLLTRTEKNIEHGLHVDYFSSKSAKITTGIFYINTNNGYTKFNNGKKIKSEQNKYVEFNSDEMHTGSSCTDEKIRVVINFNYIKFENNF